MIFTSTTDLVYDFYGDYVVLELTGRRNYFLLNKNEI